MRRQGWQARYGLLLCCFYGLATPQINAQTPSADDIEFFEKTIRPLLHDNCHSCHGPTKQRGNLRLDSREGILRGGDSGPAAVAGQPEKSLLVRAIRYADDVLRMPPRSKLAPAQIEVLTRWIGHGMVWSQSTQAVPSAPARQFDLRERSQHWCWQPLRVATPPIVLAAGQSNALDAFLDQAQRTAGITPAPRAGRAALLRRVTYDLIGLPPTRDEIADFLADQRPDAFERVVDRLLASPRHGERGARHWLDLVRYAETMGHEFDIEIPEAYRYRDYVIRAFNADVPFDQLVIEHMAGDLLDKPRLDPSGANASIQATAFWFLGQGKHSPVDVRAEEADRLDNQIDVFSKAFLGLTVACARCHDHKFDAITTADYYALTSYILGAHQQMAFLDPPEAVASALAQFREVQRRLQAVVDAAEKKKAPTRKISIPDDAKCLVDFSQSDYANWYVSGPAFGAGPTRCATPVLHVTGKPGAVLEPAGLVHSGLLDERLAGALRSPTFSIGHKYIWLHVGGVGGQVSIVIDGFEQIRDPIYGGLRFTPNTGETRVWRAVDVSMWAGHRAYIELADDGPGYLTLDAIAFSDKPPASPESRSAVPLDLPDQQLAELTAAKTAAEKTLPKPNRLPALETATPWPAHVAIRGNPNSFGAETPARFLEVFSTRPELNSQCGNRLELARQMLTNGRALLARVFVNRLWKEHLGEGLVRTPDNFGKLGEPPTHPELLDYLANEFIRRGWSIKQMHRLMLLSDAYQRGNQPEADVYIKDPQNRSQSFQPTRRLQAECIRDAILAVSTGLDQRFYGPSILPFLNAHMQGRGRPNRSGPLDGAGRRSIYLNVRRNFLSPFLVAFDYPVPFSTMGRRASSNVPAQALILLNDPFVIGKARVWADHLLQDTECSAAARINRLYLEALARPPTKAESSAALEFLGARTEGTPQDQRDAWADLCHVLFNLKEFIFVP